jgi:hypothetical protein
MNIEYDLQEFIDIWISYADTLDIKNLKFTLNIYQNIIKKIKKGEIDFYDDKEYFLQLLEDITVSIYYNKRYDYNKKYNDKELDCCSRIKIYLAKEIV